MLWMNTLNRDFIRVSTISFVLLYALQKKATTQRRQKLFLRQNFSHMYLHSIANLWRDYYYYYYTKLYRALLEIHAWLLSLFRCTRAFKVFIHSVSLIWPKQIFNKSKFLHLSVRISLLCIFFLSFAYYYRSFLHCS